MRAVIANGYGVPEVLSVQEVPKPKPKSNEILVKVKAASLNSGDVRMRALDGGDGVKGFVAKIVIRLLVGITRPKRIPGSVLAGEVVEVGDDVARFKVGDEVYAMAGFRFGAFAEYCVLPEDGTIALKPKTANFEEASTLPFGGNTAFYFLRKAGTGKGKKVLIYGSTGAVGTSAVQVAKYLGAEVTAVSGPDGMELTKQLGASTVYNYKETPLENINGKFDVVFDAVGKISKKSAAHLIAIGGHYVTVDSLDVAKEASAGLEKLSEMYDAGKLVATIDRIYDLDQIVEANHYVDSGRKKGSVVIRTA
ncbi:NAD(P)-dependent alcohol dehydrogenase [Candidatus Kaiserbacteria bacterium]|nr:NAD(P)-dependent alcohol dehydrogenase [Candidatus Kaiserbacteria bacterium]